MMVYLLIVQFCYNFFLFIIYSIFVYCSIFVIEEFKLNIFDFNVVIDKVVEVVCFNGGGIKIDVVIQYVVDNIFLIFDGGWFGLVKV